MFELRLGEVARASNESRAKETGKDDAMSVTSESNDFKLCVGFAWKCDESKAKHDFNLSVLAPLALAY